MPLSFVVRSVDEIGMKVIDWSLAGGRGCRPATGPELEMLERIAELEAENRELKHQLKCLREAAGIPT